MYQVAFKEKSQILLRELTALTQHHLDHCPPYARFFDMLKLRHPPYSELNQIPYVPATLFKMRDLLSIPKTEIYKTLVSSGTTGSVPSKIYLDRQTALSQTTALAAIMTHFLGKQRLPMLVVDSDDAISDPKKFTARGAALLGMLNFGRDPFYLLDSDMKIKHALFLEWVKAHKDEVVLIFGFTFMIWKYLLEEKILLPCGIMVHTGGWKKMEEIKVTPDAYKAKVLEMTGIRRCHNFYGMVEQVGSVFVECEHGRLHTPDFSEVIIRDPETWQEESQGVIQIMSTLPHSYPGHSLLTEDLGVILGVDDCPCGRMGRTFLVQGRVPNSELRGCSDTIKSTD